MARSLLALFIVLHGLVHLWYLALSLRLVPFRPEMGWTGQSWLLSGVLEPAPMRTLAAALFALATVGFVVGGIAFALDAGAWRAALVPAALLSSMVIVVFWDGRPEMWVEKGLLGLLIDLGLLVAVLMDAAR